MVLKKSGLGLRYENIVNRMDVRKWSLTASGIALGWFAIGRFRSYLETTSFERLIMSESGDSQLINKYSEFISVEGLNNVQFRIRYIDIPHPKAQQLPKDLPVILFIHGLGGQLNQFDALIDFYSRFAHVISLDLPGCGKSYDENCTDYTPLTLSTKGLVTVIENFIDSILKQNESILVVGHSMGASLCASLAASSESNKSRIIGFCALCPPEIGPFDDRRQFQQRVLGWTPTPIFNAFRWFDRQGGLESKSVTRMTFEGASEQVKIAQLRCNLDVKTRPWMAMASTFTPATKNEWISIGCPVYLLGAENDLVTPPANVTSISGWLSAQNKSPIVAHEIVHNAGHALMIEKPETTCNLLGDFIKANIDERLSLPWQARYLDQSKNNLSVENTV